MGSIDEYQYLSRSRPIWIYVDDLGDFAIKLRVRFFIPHIRLRRRARDFILRMVKKRFEENGIVMPYPTQQIIYESASPPPIQGKAEMK